MPSLLPFPYFYRPIDTATGEIPVTRDGVRHLDPFPFIRCAGPGYPLLSITTPVGETTNLICGLLPAKHFTDGTVSPHENTLTERLQRQQRLVTADRGALGKPVLLTAPTIAPLLTRQLPEDCPRYNYRISDRDYSLAFYDSDDLGTTLPLSDLGPLVIADGHHRAFTHAALAASGQDEFSLIPVAIAGADNLSIGAFLRVIEFAGGTPALLSKLEAYFAIVPLAAPAPVTETGQWLLGHHNQYFHLTRKDGSVTTTDPGWLNEVVLPALFGITDTRTDRRILSVEAPYRPDGSLHYPPELHDLVTLLGKPLSSERFFQEVNAGRVLPPKSTRFTPRVPSGLLVWIP